MPRIGVPLHSEISIKGLSWLGVEQTASLPPLTQSHAQPEPKRVAPASANLVLKSANEPKADLISSASLPVGSPPPSGLIIVQKRLWLKCPPPLFLTAAGYLEIFLQ